MDRHNRLRKYVETRKTNDAAIKLGYWDNTSYELTCGN